MPHLIADSRVKFQVILYGICSEKVEVGRFFIQNILVFPVSIIPAVFHVQISFIC